MELRFRRKYSLGHRTLLNWIYSDLHCIDEFILILCTFGLVFKVCIFMDFSIFLFSTFIMPSFSTFLYGILLCMEFFVELFVMESWTLTISFFIFSHVLVVSVLGPFFGLPRKEIILILEAVAVLWFFGKDEWVIHCSSREWEHLRWHNFCNRSNFHKDFLSDIVIWYWVVWTSRQRCREGL